jgi:hypothetical protein
MDIAFDMVILEVGIMVDGNIDALNLRDLGKPSPFSNDRRELIPMSEKTKMDSLTELSQYAIDDKAKVS